MQSEVKTTTKGRKPQPRVAAGTEFGQLLRQKRVEAGMSLQILSEKTGINWMSIQRLETSPRANPTLATVRTLAVALGCKPAELVV